MSDVDAADGRTPLPSIPTTGDELTNLVAFLEYYRAVFVRKVEGLDEEQVRVRVAASSIDLLGLTRHLVDVERWWFRVVMVADVDSPVYDTTDDADADWHHRPEDTLADALVDWHREVARAREIVAGFTDGATLSATGTSRHGHVSLRWILVHMIEEYARHCGHADFIRESIDGTIDD